MSHKHRANRLRASLCGAKPTQLLQSPTQILFSGTPSASHISLRQKTVSGLEDTAIDAMTNIIASSCHARGAHDATPAPKTLLRPQPSARCPTKLRGYTKSDCGWQEGPCLSKGCHECEGLRLIEKRSRCTCGRWWRETLIVFLPPLSHGVMNMASSKARCT